MTATRIYTKLAADTCGSETAMLRYAEYLRARLQAACPGAEITVDTTTRESGALPTSIEADDWQEQRRVAEVIDAAWGDWCREQ